MALQYFWSRVEGQTDIWVSHQNDWQQIHGKKWDLDNEESGCLSDNLVLEADGCPVQCLQTILHSTTVKQH